MSNSDRIAHAAAEVAARDAEKREKAKAKAEADALAPPKKRAVRKPKEPARMKLVWAVGIPGKEPVATFAYAQRAAADAAAEARGDKFRVTKARVPME